MRLQVKNMRGNVSRSIDVSDKIFDAPENPALVHQVMVAQLANKRQGTASVKTRAQVSGGGAKPRPQKGTGRARQGTIRAPHWRGGGIVFGPAPRSYRQRTPKRMKRIALASVLSAKARNNELIVIEDLTLDPPKTKELMRILDALGATPSILLACDGADDVFVRCARNIPRVKTLPASLLNTVDLLNHRSVVLTLDAIRRVEEIWAIPNSRLPVPVVENSVEELE